ncbi:hypothetical protein AVEN_264955-1 [Araneus ventricosus]|uniref:Uncharacterized protein n=1 Tax=Araneus ventricosus TaxID=182803 RepID=A0A4Y2PA78_ARAVE|nr:hypothetical protein AVEN_264955-1 [Araneus ventricosus]
MRWTELVIKTGESEERKGDVLYFTERDLTKNSGDARSYDLYCLTSSGVKSSKSGSPGSIAEEGAHLDNDSLMFGRGVLQGKAESRKTRHRPRPHIPANNLSKFPIFLAKHLSNPYPGQDLKNPFHKAQQSRHPGQVLLATPYSHKCPNSIFWAKCLLSKQIPYSWPSALATHILAKCLSNSIFWLALAPPIFWPTPSKSPYSGQALRNQMNTNEL